MSNFTVKFICPACGKDHDTSLKASNCCPKLTIYVCNICKAVYKQVPDEWKCSSKICSKEPSNFTW